MKGVKNKTDSTLKGVSRGTAPKGWQRKFLSALEDCGNVTHACDIACVNRTTVYALKKSSEEFAANWSDSLAIAIDGLEATAWKRARASSDVLLIFLLKANVPAKYRETTRLEHSGQIAGQSGVVIYVPDDGRNLPDADPIDIPAS